MKDKTHLYEMYNATSNSNKNGQLETYENWLEKQVLSRIEKLDSIREESFKKLFMQEFDLKDSPYQINKFLIKENINLDNIKGITQSGNIIILFYFKLL